MTDSKQLQNSSRGRRAGKLMLSSALILGSGAYAWTQHTSAPEPARAAAGPPQVQVSATRAITAPAAPTALSQAAPMPSAPQRLIDASGASQSVETPRATESAVEQPQSAPADPLPQKQGIADEAAVTPPPVTLASSVPPSSGPVESSNRYADGDFTGPPADTAWGLVQVRVSVRGGAIATVDPIDYPSHRRRSVQINSWALPILEREVIQAQSAKVDIISQATTTSVGYLQSLSTALT